MFFYRRDLSKGIPDAFGILEYLENATIVTNAKTNGNIFSNWFDGSAIFQPVNRHNVPANAIKKLNKTDPKVIY